jgi:phosphatidylserine decarboxylase
MHVPDVTPDLPSRTWRVVLAALGRLPQASLSRAFGALADAPLPPSMRPRILGTFARALGIDVTEAARPLEDYTSINEFFVRELRAGARPFPGDPQTLACPVDGIAGQHGRIREGKLLQAKGRWYSGAELLDDAVEAQRFNDGAFLTLYLSPRHYHRIHAPCDGVIPLARHVPGALLPVNNPSVSHVADLFVRNERLLCYIDGPLGRVAVVAVGAYNVGRISAAFDRAWADGRSSPSITNLRGAARTSRVYDPPKLIRQGDEIMAFHLGSTVVLMFEPNRVRLVETLAPGAEVRLGSVIGRASMEVQ